jgi:hypothetical protein
MGLTPLVVDDAARAAMSAADFGSSCAITLGDPRCSLSRSLSPSRFSTAMESRAVLGPDFDGGVMIIGSDPTQHGHCFIALSDIAFATNEPTKTNIVHT